MQMELMKKVSQAFIVFPDTKYVK